MKSSEIKNKVSDYYSEKLNQWGPVPRGVDWNSGESQEIRFEQLLKVCDFSKPFSLNDLGCGYGALYGFMADRGYDFEYHGYDLSEVMIEKAGALYGEKTNSHFVAKRCSRRGRLYNRLWIVQCQNGYRTQGLGEVYAWRSG